MTADPLTPRERIPMLLWCPGCGARHLDVGEFATKPHHTHACQKCGMVWRPAIEPTVGVEFLPGFKNAEPPSPPQDGGSDDPLGDLARAERDRPKVPQGTWSDRPIPQWIDYAEHAELMTKERDASFAAGVEAAARIVTDCTRLDRDTAAVVVATIRGLALSPAAAPDPLLPGLREAGAMMDRTGEHERFAPRLEDRWYALRDALDGNIAARRAAEGETGNGEN